LAWEAMLNSGSVARAADFFNDLRLIVSGEQPIHAGWKVETATPGMSVFRATHIQKL